MIDLLNMKIPSHNEELKRLLELIPDRFYKKEGSIFFDIFSVIAHRNIKLYEMIQSAFLNSFSMFAKGEALDLCVNEVGLSRKQGVKAVGNVSFYGENGTFIPHGTVVLCDDLEFLVIKDSVVENGKAIVRVEAVEVGSKYNIKSGKINKLSSGIIGIREVKNEENIESGIDVESDELLLQRYYSVVREPSTSGNAYDYKKWATSVSGIGSAKIEPTWAGAGTVKVSVVSEKGTEVEPEKLKELKEFIETRRPIGVDVTVTNSEIMLVDISVNITFEKYVEIENMKEKIKNKIRDYLNQSNLLDNKVRYSSISNILLNTEGVIDYDNLLLNGQNKTLNIPNNSISKLNEVRINEN